MNNSTSKWHGTHSRSIPENRSIGCSSTKINEERKDGTQNSTHLCAMKKYRFCPWSPHCFFLSFQSGRARGCPDSRVIGGAAVVVTVRFRAVVLGTPGLCSVSDFLNATIFGLSPCFVDAGRSIRQACSMIRNEGDLFRSCSFMCIP